MTTAKVVPKPATPKPVVPTKTKPVARRAKLTAAPKAAATPAAASGAKAVPAAPQKPKHKLVRDSFTIPKAEYAVLEALKARATNLKRPTKKSEMLRAGIAALNAMPDQTFLQVLNSIPSLKTGRPQGADAPAEAAKKARK